MKRKCLAVGIILLFVGTCIIPAIAQNSEKPVPASRGNWLYVGGSGPGNYSRIQDAVDNASDRDTVFVFDDSSPYKGVILVSKSITIQGENKNTTIINSGGFNISVSNVTITGFRIQNSETGVHIIGTEPTPSYNTVDNNIFSNVSTGINIYDNQHFEPKFTGFGYNIISNNVIICGIGGFGIDIYLGQNNIVIGNDISQDDKYHDPDNWGVGIYVFLSSFNNISYNNVHDNGFGIELVESNRNNVYRNTIKENYLDGMLVVNPSFDRIIQNNFINNHRDVRIWRYIYFQSYIAYLPLPAIFDRNYWDKARIFPHPIGGLFALNLGITALVWYMLFGEKGEGILLDYYSNFVRFDWHPAKEIYDIGV
jgi:parallel beta-helix repeat protein